MGEVPYVYAHAYLVAQIVRLRVGIEKLTESTSLHLANFFKSIVQILQYLKKPQTLLPTSILIRFRALMGGGEEEQREVL